MAVAREWCKLNITGSSGILSKKGWIKFYTFHFYLTTLQYYKIIYKNKNQNKNTKLIK